LSQKTVLAVAKVFESCFEYNAYPGSGLTAVYHVRVDWLGDFFFEREYPPQLVSLARAVHRQRGAIKAFIIDLWGNGGTLSHLISTTMAFPALTDRNQFAQDLMLRLARDIIDYARRKDILIKPAAKPLRELQSALEADGYAIKDGRIIVAEQDVIDVVEEANQLVQLFNQLNLEKPEQFAHDLKEAEEQYANAKFGAAIKHSRDAMEIALMGVARAVSKLRQKNLPRTALPGPVRAFLHTEKVITDEEKELLFALHTILSVKGGHANMSERDDARICRQYALTTTHFVLLRWKTMLEQMASSSSSPEETAPS